METHIRSVNSDNIAPTEAYVPTSEIAITPEEEDAIVTLVVVVIGIVIAIVVLFVMGIFIDCKHQKADSLKKKKLRLKMPPLARGRRKDDSKTLASDMCPNGISDTAFKTRDEIV
ncbi:uncharacterized protein LOC109855781 [Pseudomyrmex gracilis]|uniref:uncharacterized protein LOC109855781 n=1 Tax=Pseudomyrmex gracilis TaxID=219809 RepID=UPI000994B30E|nr:uncharacterized protein LOC109855781 [Pseudomyrmex gracilis]